MQAMFGDTENVLEVLRGIPSVCLFLVVPIILMTASFSPVCSTRDFTAFRMQQYDLNGVKYGSRSAVVNLEVRSLTSDTLVRRCALARVDDLHIDRLQKYIQDGLSALLVLLPAKLDLVAADIVQQYNHFEQDLMEADLPIPVYFAPETDDLRDLYYEVSASRSSDSASSALQAMTSVASVNSFHFVSDVAESKAMHDFPIVSLFGKLIGQGLEDQLPTIAVVTHYDSFSIIPKLSKGIDSSGSGVIAFLEILRLFSKLYERTKTQPRYNLLFLLAGGGKFNYQGTKKWIEENLESSEISLLSEVEYVLCLDALGGGSDLYLHVSKPPKEGSPGYLIYQELKQVSEELHPSVPLNLVHKKVNLADELLAWEHERFSLRRLPAGTLTHFSKPTKLVRGSVFDASLDVATLQRNIKIVAEGLARHIFNLSGKGYPGNLEVFADDFSLDENHVFAWLEQLSSQPRSQQLISRDHKLLTSLEEAMARHLKDVKRVFAKADKKDPEFLFYDAFDAKINVYSVKPALFDLFLASAIAAYLGLVYLLIENFAHLRDMLPKSLSNGKGAQ